ncbi:MAG TPA: ATP-binding cassette domain-containing protein [Puia sp.]|jgi:molybdate transport system ATP-binding protein|nr:ATP-binding cassette domain-containing protein [Puia sp.]
MVDTILTLEGVTVTLGGVRLLDDLDWTIRRGEQWAVVGPAGSGKTILAHTLLGLHFASGRVGTQGLRIGMVEQQHRFRGLPGAAELYYQQRFNSMDADATITVAEEFEVAGISREPDADWLDRLHVRALLPKPLIQLSNGENKRVQLVIALLGKPDVLILDNPFLGLDVEGRSVLHGIIDRLAADGMPILLITGEREMPSCITHVARLGKGKWSFLGPRTDFEPAVERRSLVQLDAEIMSKLKEEGIQPAPAGESRNIAGEATDHPLVICMRGVTIRYGQATILDNIDWEVRKGERWNVSGPNGAGKSTLLSLITADNPQAYANDIRLFGRRRGTGETIWEIKQKIGFVSPELHLYFDSGASCFEVVASGLFDTIGLFRPLAAEQEEAVMRWMKLLSLQDLRMRRLPQLSTGQQRMVLLARALIKNPPMLILDEPCQGLDEEQMAYFRELVDELCEAFDKTLIYVSHYRQELPRCVDRFLRLEGGKRVE